MGETFSRIGPATVRHNDYLGTVAADDAEAWVRSKSIYQLVGLDREQWLIMGLALSRSRGRDRVRVYAVDRLVHGIGSLADLDDLLESVDGQVPVMSFDLPSDILVHEFISEAFDRIAIRLVPRSVGSHRLSVAQSCPLHGLVTNPASGQ